MRVLLNIMILPLLCASVHAQTNRPVLLPSTRELQQRHLLGPEQAMQKVQQFVGNTDALIMLQGFADYNPTNSVGICYSYRIKQGPRAGSYCISAVDGSLLMYVPEYKGADSKSDQPVLSLAEAQAIAERFLCANYPRFTQTKWELTPQKYIENNLPNSYEFSYYRVINPQTGARMALSSPDVHVNATDGTIQRFDRLPDYPYNGPSIPRVSREQAIQVATQFAPYDVNLVPFDEVSLNIEYNIYQIPYLTWHLHQKPPVFDSRFNSPGYMSVDAITGRFSPGSGAFGGGGWGKPSKEAERYLNKNVKPLPPPPMLITIRKADDKPLFSGDNIVIQDGQVWLRAELLRGLGATVDAQPKTLHITLDKHELTDKSVGAKYHDYGWWVPLDKTMQAVDWHMTWNVKTQEAIVEPVTTTPQPAQPKTAP